MSLYYSPVPKKPKFINIHDYLNLPMPESTTSPRMNLLYDPVCLGHDTGDHPENKKRLKLFDHLPITPFPNGEIYLDLVHTPAYIQKVREHSQAALNLDGDTLLSEGSYAAACHAVGATYEAAQKGDFALVRPPGHHAYATHGSGFCLFNNVAIAAQKLVLEGKRVLIFDFDGHLGDGTSAIFYRTDKVLYWSTHQYPAFPGHGFINEIGEGSGLGFNFNVPLPPGSADDIFLHALDHFLPLAAQFNPDVVAISAGFDANQFDPLLDLRFSNNAFYRVGQRIAAQFPHVFAVMEGGYHLNELEKGVLSFLAGMNGQPMPFEEPHTVSGMRIWETYEMYLHGALGKLKPYWKM